MMSKQQNVCDLVEKLTGIVSMFSVFAFLLKFTPVCRFVVPVCYVCDILFVMLIFLRLKLYGAVEYLGSWQNIVDLFSAVPIIVLFARQTSAFQLLTPAASFTLFRLLNIIPVVKSSELAKKHFKQICFWVILIETFAIFGMNVFFRSFFNQPVIERYTSEYERFPSNPEYLMKNDANVILVYKNGTIQSRKGFIRDKKTHFAIANSSSEYLIKISFSEESIISDGKINAPKCGIIVKSPELLAMFDYLMLIIMLPAIIMIIVILWRDLLSKDAKRLSVASDAVKSGDFSDFDEELKLIEKSDKNELSCLYSELDNLRQRFPDILQHTEIAESEQITENEASAETGGGDAAPALEPEKNSETAAESLKAEAGAEPVAEPVVEPKPAETVEAQAESVVEPESIEPAELETAQFSEPIEKIVEPAEVSAEPIEVADTIEEPEPIAAVEVAEAETELESAEVVELEVESAVEPELDELVEADAVHVAEPAEQIELAEVENAELEAVKLAEPVEEIEPIEEEVLPSQSSDTEQKHSGLLAIALKKRGQTANIQ